MGGGAAMQMTSNRIYRCRLNCPGKTHRPNDPPLPPWGCCIGSHCEHCSSFFLPLNDVHRRWPIMPILSGSQSSQGVMPRFSARTMRDADKQAWNKFIIDIERPWWYQLNTYHGHSLMKQGLTPNTQRVVSISSIPCHPQQHTPLEYSPVAKAFDAGTGEKLRAKNDGMVTLTSSDRPPYEDVPSVTHSYSLTILLTRRSSVAIIPANVDLPKKWSQWRKL